MTGNVISAVDEFFSELELVELASMLAKFHRIQGSRDLERAGKYIEDEMRSLMEFDVNTYTYKYGTRYGLHPPVMGWNLRECFAELTKPYRKTLITHLHTKICAVAHSPPGDVEGEIVYVGEGSRASHYRDKNISDRIVLAYGNTHLVYRIAVRFGARGFIFFKLNVHEDAIPYLSLFLSPEEAKTVKAPAIAISRRDAYSIISMIERGLKPHARIFIDAEHFEDAKINVVEAAIGEGERELHIYAHYCHPAGTVNDNVSGAATLLELAKALDRAVHRSVIAVPKYMRIVFVWFPEYYGSLPYLLSKSSRGSLRIEFGVNLDMIGEKQELTKSTINVVRPPAFVDGTKYESVVVKYLIESLSTNRSFSNTVRILSYRIDISPYDGGSDHDIYLQFSIPSMMINQWPDAFYHTNLDTIDKFDPFLAKRIGIGVVTALYAIASNSLSREAIEILDNAYRNYVKGYTMLKRDVEVLRGTISTKVPSGEDLQKNSARYRYIGDKGVLTLRHIINSYNSVEDIDDLLNFLEKQPIQFLFTHYIPLLLMHKPLGIDEVKLHIAAEYGININESTLGRVISYLKQLNLIEEVAFESQQ